MVGGVELGRLHEFAAVGFDAPSLLRENTTINTQPTNPFPPNLLAEIDSAIGAFNQPMKDLAAADSDFSYADVLGFQASDFNRTFTPNGAPGDLLAGTDHAWGTHAMMFGGAVDGRKFYGEFPDLTVGSGGTQDTPNNNRGRWIPTTSVDQYTAVLSSWFGVDTTNGDMDLILPNLDRFYDLAAAKPPVGFLL